jgi:citrate synthase
MTDELHRGLEGVLVDESAISRIDGDAGRLIYRGYPIADLAEDTSFEEVLYLLWYGDLPNSDELDDFTDRMQRERAIDERTIDTLRGLAKAGETPMAALRTGISMLSANDPESTVDPSDPDVIFEKGRRITAKVPTILAAYDRLRNGEEPIAPSDDLSHAENFLFMLTGEYPSDVAAETFDMALTLHADHGINASTFTAMTIASTRADIYSATTGGVGALSGPLHGGANQAVIEVLQELDESGKDPLEWTKEALAEGRRIPGWGHRVYTVTDPRAKILEQRSAALAESTGEAKWHEYTQTIEEHLRDEKGLPAKGIAPNVDFYSGSVYYQLGIPTDLYTPIFAMSRVSGWVAHVQEYVSENRLIRPRARYVGPDNRTVVPIEDR